MASRRPGQNIALALAGGERVPVPTNMKMPKARLTINKLVIDLGGEKSATLAFDAASGQMVKLVGGELSTLQHGETLGPAIVGLKDDKLTLKFFIEDPDAVYLQQMTEEEKLRISGVTSQARLFWARRTVPQRIAIVLGIPTLLLLGGRALADTDMPETQPSHLESGMQVDD